MYLLDTNSLDLLLAGDEAVLRRVEQHTGAVHSSSIAAEEKVTGRLNIINKARGPRTSLSLAQAHEDFVQTIRDLQLLPILTFSEEVDEVFRSLPASAIRKGAQDARIAAQALTHGLTVVTRNLRDFEAIGAPCEDWIR